MKYGIVVALFVIVCSLAQSEELPDLTDTTWCVVNHISTFETSGECLDVSVVDGYCYLIGWGGVTILDVADPGAPSMVGTCGVGGFVNCHDVAGDHLYLCGEGLYVLDVSNPENPVQVGSLALPDGIDPAFCDIDVEGDYAYLALFEQGLWVVDVSDPIAPTLLADFSPDSLSVVSSVHVVGSYAYATAIIDSGEPEGLLILDVSLPASPSWVEFQPVGSAKDVFVSGSRAYVGSSWPNHYMGTDYGLSTVDITVPANPVLLGSCATYPCGIQGSRLFVTDGYVYIAGDENGIFDVTDPSAPFSMCTVGGLGYGVFVQNDLAFYACSHGLDIYEVRIAPCCGFWADGYTGNANCSDDGLLTLSDITRLIDYVFVSKEPLCCEGNGNTNGSEDLKITLADISRLIDRVFISKNATEPCL